MLFLLKTWMHITNNEIGKAGHLIKKIGLAHSSGGVKSKEHVTWSCDRHSLSVSHQGSNMGFLHPWSSLVLFKCSALSTVVFALALLTPTNMRCWGLSSCMNVKNEPCLNCSYSSWLQKLSNAVFHNCSLLVSIAVPGFESYNFHGGWQTPWQSFV